MTRDCDAITIRAFLNGSGINVCEKVACKLYPEIQLAIDWLNQYGNARMTGTGACVFAAFDSLEQAEGVVSRAPSQWDSFVAKAMNKNPVLTQCGMPVILSLLSPAKLNLMLHITGRRDDGYHMLQTVFQFIDLSDQMEFRLTSDGSIQRNISSTPVSEADDISILAALLLQEKLQVDQGVQISIDKRIPIGGGLGGGSSNAATTLLALNQMWGHPGVAILV